MGGGIVAIISFLLSPNESAIFIALLAVLAIYLVIDSIKGGLKKDHIPHGEQYSSKSGSRPVGYQTIATETIPMVSFAEVREEYERRVSNWHAESKILAKQQVDLDALDYRSLNANEVLNHATSDERINLATILGIAADSSSDVMIDALRKAGSHSVTSLVRGSHVPYEEVVKDVAIKLGAKPPITATTAVDLERLAISAAFDSMLSKSSPEQRKVILAEIASKQGQSSTDVMTAAGGLALANLSGFGLYVAASSALSAITGAIGLTLPFAVYTGMSSILAAITGPVGWVTLLSAAIYKMGSTDYKKTIPGVIAISSSRARLIADREEKLERLEKQRHQLEIRTYALQDLRAFLERMRESGPDHRVPKASVPW
jgi:uncharacterized protein YaaW (UPF0174 family)